MTAVAQVSDAFVAYPSPAGTVMALRGLDLRVEAGERLLIQGPNGSGKSTLLRLLTGEQPLTAGAVQVAGTDLHRMTARARRRWRRTGVGVIDQHARRALLPEWRVVENVALQLRLTGLPRRVAVRRAGETLDRLGLAALGDRSISTLSGGEAARAAICAALAHDPALILADEPTGELDDVAARQVYELLAQASRTRGAALILISHDRRAWDSVDRAVRMRHGRVAEQWYPARGRSESQVVDPRGWLRLPADLAAPAGPAAPMAGSPVPAPMTDLGTTRGPATLRASAMPDGQIRLTPDLDPAAGEDSPAAAPTAPTRRVIPVAVLPPATFSNRPILRIRNVAVLFSARTVLAHVDLTVAPGECVVLRGASGSGKSTLLGLAAGLLDPSSGSVEVGGTAWATLDRNARAGWRRRHVTVALQHTILAEALTVEENLRFAALLHAGGDNPGPGRHGILDHHGRAGGEIDAVTGSLGLTGLRSQPVHLLSGGERQRVAVARCLVSGAALMLLDEPTSQQDEASAVAVARAVRAATERGRAVLAASHDPVFLEAAGSLKQLQMLSGQPPR